MKIDFEFDTPYGKFRDSIWFSGNVHMLSNAEIEIIKQERLKNWLVSVEAASMVVSETESISTSEVEIDSNPQQ